MEHKICFIICYNDDLFLSECCLYIHSLIVPEGYEIDIISVKEAGSMAEGYQYAMLESDAKYKVYLHQDVFIVNPNFLTDILNIFEQDSSIGMIGMVGAVELPESAVMWEGERCGALYMNYIVEESEAYFDVPIKDVYQEVKAVDGLLLATSVDIPWRADLFQGWDFYDLSQSMEFQRAGYKIVVPFQEKPWCIHDDDILELTHFDHWRQVFLENYWHHKSVDKEKRKRKMIHPSPEEKKRKLRELVLEDKMDEAVLYCNKCMDGVGKDNHLVICIFLFSIWHLESERQEPFCIFDISNDLFVLLRHYHILKFLVRRLEFDWIQTDSMELVDYCTQYRVSHSALACVISASTRNPGLVSEKVNCLFQNGL